MKVKEFAGMQMMFAETTMKFDIAMSESASDERTALTVENYGELGELEVDYWEVCGNRMCLYCSRKEGNGMESKKVFDANGNPVDFDTAVNLMDDDLREEVHGDIAPCTDQEFFDEYSKRHEQRFGGAFAPYSGDAW